METFKTVGEASKYLIGIYESCLLAGKADDAIGHQCVLTGLPMDHKRKKRDEKPDGAKDVTDRYKKVRTAFWLKGVRVTAEGPFGERLITFRGVIESKYQFKRR